MHNQYNQINMFILMYNICDIYVIEAGLFFTEREFITPQTGDQTHGKWSQHLYLYYWLTAFFQVIPWAPAGHICQSSCVWLTCVIVGACHRSCWHPAVNKVKVLQKQLDSQKKELRLKGRSIARLKKSNKTLRDVMMRLLKENNNLKKRQQNLIDNRE